MIKIAIAAALAALITWDIAVLPASTGTNETIERPRGHKGDRLPIHQPGIGCADVVWPHHQGDCVGRREQPSEQAPAARYVRVVAIERGPAGHAASSFGN